MPTMDLKWDRGWIGMDRPLDRGPTKMAKQA